MLTFPSGGDAMSGGDLFGESGFTSLANEKV